MKRWMQVNDVLTQEEWDALQPKPELTPDQWDGWHACYLFANCPTADVFVWSGIGDWNPPS